MDVTLLNFFNHSLAHPTLDVFMVGITTMGFASLPVLGLILLLIPGQRKTGTAILVSLVAGFILSVVFQYLGQRPRPEIVRLLLPAPHFPAYPSGHAVAGFSVAVVVGLTYRQWYWWGGALAGATLIGVSRVYLGHHYPSDIFGGAVLGVAVGAACYGLLGLSRPDWRWLLWPQIAVVMIVTQMAYLDILPSHLLQWPLADKVLHFLLFGMVVFWLNLWLQGRSMQAGQWTIPVAILVPFSVAMLEEGAQTFSPLRSVSLGDLTSDLLGMVFFWWLSTKFLKLPSIAKIN